MNRAYNLTEVRRLAHEVYWDADVDTTEEKLADAILRLVDAIDPEGAEGE